MSAEGPSRVPPPIPAGGRWSEWIEWANALPNLTEIGMRCLDVGPGRAELMLDESPWTPNPNGAVNGGLVVAAADQCMGIVALTAFEHGTLPATATLFAEFLRPAFAPLSLRATVAQRGQRLVFVAVTVTDGRGRLCVRCSGTMAAQSSPQINDR